MNVEAGATDDGRIRIPGIQGRILPWAAAAALFAVLWLVTLLWALEHRRAPAAAPSPEAARPASRAGLKRVLEDGDLADIADALCASVDPPASGIDTLRNRIGDDTQRDALDLLQRARWGDGDPRFARERLRKAFARGVVEASDRPAPGRDLLPPLYPRP